MRVNLIFARSRNGVIGCNGALPWHLPEDLAHFKRLTAGSPVVMGRKTWDSLPPRFRPLPGRTNVVVTRQADWRAVGARAAGDLQQALAMCATLEPPPADVWVIGGAQLYRLALPFASRAVVTELDIDVMGDTHAPSLDGPWIESSREHQTSSTGMHFAFVTYLQLSITQGI